MDSGNGHAEIVKTIVSLAQNLGMHVAAEGLETSGQFQQLRELQCEFGQGFYFSKPLEPILAGELLTSKPRW
jgi:EAL domain-containing protein (putative c-di-GMP-specific phosphodiesterase class I)